MAIRRKTEETKQSLPASLAELLLQGFSYQQIKDKYDQAFKATKGKVSNYLEHNEDGFSVDLGKGFKCDQGTVIVTQGRTMTVNKDRLVELVESGRITLASVLNMAKFNMEEAEKLRSMFIEEKELVKEEKKGFDSLTFRASAEFKSEVDERFAALLPPAEETSPAPAKVAPVKVAKPALPITTKPTEAASVASAIEKIRAAAKKAKPEAVAVTTADDDLNDILGESNE